MDKRDCTALIVIDVQHDFLPGGALAVSDGDAVIAPVNALMQKIDRVILTQDWHPAGHSSFASSHAGRQPFETVTMAYGEQTLWPEHCIQGSHGATFHEALDQDRAELILRKGFNPAIDSYSAFQENDRVTTTGLDGYLRERGISRLVLAGLAFDYCVAWSALDAAARGYETLVVRDACRGIDLDGSMAAAENAMLEAGVQLVSMDEVAN